jgi:type IV secretion system protein VirB10
MRLACCLLVLSILGNGQENPPDPSVRDADADAPVTVTVPAGTRVPLALQHSISTKNARTGDRVYLRSTFPVAHNNRILIPPGTYVQGVIGRVKRPGRVSGRAEVLLHFTAMIFPNGYTVSLPGAVENVPDAEDAKIKDKEGTIQSEGQAGTEAATVAGTAASGTLIGGLSQGGKGAGIGAGVGAGVGLAAVLLTRGKDVRLDPGTLVEMVLQRPLTLEESKLTNAPRELVPVDRNRTLKRPVLTPPADTR